MRGCLPLLEALYPCSTSDQFCLLSGQITILLSSGSVLSVLPLLFSLLCLSHCSIDPAISLSTSSQPAEEYCQSGAMHVLPSADPCTDLTLAACACVLAPGLIDTHRDTETPQKMRKEIMNKQERENTHWLMCLLS